MIAHRFRIMVRLARRRKAMRYLAIFPLILLSVGSSASPPAPGSAAAVPPLAEVRPPPPDSLDRINAFREGPGCTSIPRQVAGTDRSRNGTRLDQQPPGRAILAVDRQVNGCHEVALLSQERRR
jgi:hypothetical protein